jgi:Mobilization protein NikA
MSNQVTNPVPSAANGATRRRRVDGGRHRAVNLRLDDAEYAAISSYAASAKLSIQRFIVSCALTGTAPASPAPSALTAEIAGVRRLTANLANNVNQIARKLNSGGVPDSSIPATAEAVRRVMLRLDSVLAGLPGVSSAQRPPSPRPPGSSG